jgi:hypothetical protein
VHFPTDINLLYDAIRKVISLTADQCETTRLTNWRQYQYNIRTLKRQLRIIGKLRKSTSKDEEKKREKENQIIEAHRCYLELAEKFMDKAAGTVAMLRDDCSIDEIFLDPIEQFLVDCYRQSDQIRRRVIEGEVIPQDEKMFSVFEKHTEWISKGKAGVPVELGLRVCVMNDQHGFILHHRVMQNETDDKIAVLMVEEAQERYSNFTSCSFDKGFYTPSNQIELTKSLDLVVLPKKGRLSLADKERQNSDDYKKIRRAHSAVESGINALEVHGLDKCPDHGIDGFKRYVALAVVGRNLQMLGAILQSRERENKKAA